MKRSERLISTIKSEGIQPIPSWRIRFGRVLAWLGYGLVVVLGGLAFSVILLSIQLTDFSVLAHLSHSRLEFLLGLLPFLWLAGLIIFLVLSIIALRRSPRGYKLNWSRLVGYNVALSILLGAFYFMAGGAQQLERAFALHMSWYQGLEERKARVWNAPEAGRLAGRIDELQDSILTLEDFNGIRWRVDYGQAFIPPVLEPVPGDTIKLLGDRQGGQIFRATELRPWGGPGRRRRGRR